MEYHQPVLLNECINGLNIHPSGVYVDVTFGGGGHSKKIIEKIVDGKLIAFDQDSDSIQNVLKEKNFTLINQNFKYLKNFLRVNNALPVHGVLADLGVSSHQFDSQLRGFSTRFESPLDMRMDTNIKLTAADILNSYSEENLEKIFRDYGDIENSKRLAFVINSEKIKKTISTSSELKMIINKCIKRGKENQYYAKVFQALRIEVNNEIENLKNLLIQCLEVLKPGGRLVIISYHSLEDRLVKNFMRSGKFEGEVEKDFFGNNLSPFVLITRKAIVPSESEVNQNNRSRSAKLRIAEKK